MGTEARPGYRHIRGRRYRQRVTVLALGLLVTLFGTAVLTAATATAEGENYTIATDTTLFSPPR